jgi:hypothetical protein
VAIVERVAPRGYRWTPTATAPAGYSGRHRHRHQVRRRFSLLAMFYVAAHARYVPRHASAPARAPYVPRHSRLA